MCRSRGIPYYVNAATGESTWDRPSGEPAEQVQALHILKKHQGSRRPRSWRNPEKDITRTKEEAVDLITQLRERLEDVADPSQREEMFRALAEEESDCSSAQPGRGGDLGLFGRGMMQRAFEEAAFACEVGGLSGIVDSDSGIHVILRVA